MPTPREVAVQTIGQDAVDALNGKGIVCICMRDAYRLRTFEEVMPQLMNLLGHAYKEFEDVAFKKCDEIEWNNARDSE